MPRTSKADAPVAVDEPMIEARYVQLGGYTVAFETHKADMDPAPLFHGLPGDRCQCPHQGIVLAGRIVFRYADHDEVFTAGDAYYGGPGHLTLLFAGTELVEFSPTEALNETMAVVGNNQIRLQYRHHERRHRHRHIDPQPLGPGQPAAKRRPQRTGRPSGTIHDPTVIPRPARHIRPR